MTTITHDLLTILPELFVLVMACTVLLAALFLPKNSKWIYHLTQLTLLVALFLVMYLYRQTGSGGVTFAFGGQYVFDVMAYVLKCFICISVFFTFVYSRVYNRNRSIQKAEYYVLGLLSTLGMLILVSSHSLLTLYLGLELFSLPTFAMVAMYRGSMPASEAAMKYFVISALASGLLLYGFSFLFGLTQQLDIAKIAAILSQPGVAQHGAITAIALVLVIAGVAFKLGAAPFQMWVPDVYQGAPTLAVGWMAVAVKASSFFALCRFLYHTGGGAYLDQILIALSIVTMILGNLAALNQQSLKRMLAYSGIAHSGYLMIPLIVALSGNDILIGASLPFYLCAYAGTTLAAFGVLTALSKATDKDQLGDLNGLAKSRPLLALGFTVSLISLAGIPLTAGFIGKLMIFRDAIGAGFVQLAIIGILTSLVSVYYYLRPIVAMWFRDPRSSFDLIPAPWGVQFTVGACAIATIVFGIFPDWLVELSRISVETILG